MRLNGWMRIGVILSVVWMVGNSGYRFSEEMATQRAYSDFMYNARVNCIGQNGLRQYNREPEQACVSQEAVNATYNQTVPWSMILFPPTFWLVLTWIGIGIAYGSIRWIMRGFKTRTD